MIIFNNVIELEVILYSPFYLTNNLKKNCIQNSEFFMKIFQWVNRSGTLCIPIRILLYIFFDGCMFFL